jgi:uncharacterized protein YuzE
MKKNKLNKAKVKYDFEDDIFSAMPLNRNYASSFQIGNIIFDLDSENIINGIEILNASKVFNLPKLFLKNNISGRLDIIVNDKYIKLHIAICTIIRNSQKSGVVDIERIKPDFLENTQLNLAVLS